MNAILALLGFLALTFLLLNRAATACQRHTTQLLHQHELASRKIYRQMSHQENDRLVPASQV